MTKHAALRIALTSVGLFLAVVAFGAKTKKEANDSGTQDAGNLRRLMDADGDGKISLAEYKAWRYRVAHRNFAVMDSNRDGKIDFNEYIARQGEKERGRFYWLDTANKGFQSDGVFDAAEATEEGALPTFTKHDINKDGKVDWDEWNTAWLAQKNKMFAKRDTNGDGWLSFTEANPKIDEHTAEKFKEYDTNKDGFLSEAEFVAAAVQIAKEHAERQFNEIDEE